MELINGKFYKDEKEVPLEIGNKEQIKLLRAELAYQEELEEEFGTKFTTNVKFNVELHTTAFIEIMFKCKCGKSIKLSREKDDVSNYYDSVDAEIDLTDEFLQLEKQCSCGKKYTFLEKNDMIWAQIKE